MSRAGCARARVTALAVSFLTALALVLAFGSTGGARAADPDTPAPPATTTAPTGAPTVPPGSAAAASDQPAPPALSVTGACLLDESSGQALYTFNAEGELAIASTTKLMTALVTLQHVHNLGVVYSQNDYYPAEDDSQIGLVPGDKVSVHDLLLALMLPSADDAAEDLAYNVGGGSITRFIGWMNADAKTLGLDHTHYSTPSGLDTPGNYSSPCDLVHLARYDLQHSPFFRRIVDLKSATIEINGEPLSIVNRDDLLDDYPWINGVKTGHTNDAGYVLVSSGTQHGMTLIGSVLGTSSETARDQNGLAQLEWGFANFSTVQLMRHGEVLARLPVKDRPGFMTPVIAGGSYRRVLAHSAKVTHVLQLPHQLVGPLKRHAVVGQLLLEENGRVLKRIPVLLARYLPSVSSLAIAARFISRPSTLLFIFAAFAVLIALAVIWRLRNRSNRRGITLTKPA